MIESSFEAAFKKVVSLSGRRAYWRSWEFVDIWEEMVDEIINGYEWSLYEYEDEISVRDDLEKALESSSLNQFHDWSGLVRRTLAADNKLEDLLGRGAEIRDSEFWWHRRIPPHGGPDFVEDVKRIYGICLDTI